MVLLYPKTLDEARRDYRWQSDPELMGLSGYPRLEETFVQYLSDSIIGYKKQPHRELFAIKTIAENEHIGNCSLYDVDYLKKEAQLGILIGERTFWDMGYGTDAVAALTEHAFKEMGLGRVYLRTRENNMRAIMCFKRYGFAPYGTRWQDGYNFILMELFSFRY
jgi:RimJ/RimL family protein N-acetyltransferase